MVFVDYRVVETAPLPANWLTRLHRPLTRLGILISCLGLVSAGLAVQAGYGLAQVTPVPRRDGSQGRLRLSCPWTLFVWPSTYPQPNWPGIYGPGEHW